MMANMSSGMMVGMGIVWILVLAFLVLGIAAFIKYLRTWSWPLEAASRRRWKKITKIREARCWSPKPLGSTRVA